MVDRTALVIKDWLNSSLSEIKHPKFKGCKRVKDVQVSTVSEELIKVMSETFRVVVTMEMDDGGSSSVTGIAKLEQSENSSALAQHYDVFRTETHVYNKIIIAMEKLLLENGGDETDFLWADCYYCADNKFLFVDLCESGYKIVPMKNLLDLSHIKLAMAALGRFHALSMVLEEKGELDKPSMAENRLSENLDPMMKLYKFSLNCLADVIETSWEPKWLAVPNKLRTVATKVQDLFLSALGPLNGKCDVITHGDCTMRNIMFLYKGSTTPLGAKLIDFQSSSYSTLVLDLVYVLHSSVLPQVREANLDTLLHTHWSNLSETCNKMGYKGTVPTLQDITSWYKSLSLIGFLHGILLLPIFMSSQDDGIQLKLPENFDSIGDAKRSLKDLQHMTSSKVKEALQFEVQRSLDHNIIW